VFLRKKKGRRTYQGRYRAIVIDRDKAFPSFQRDHDRGARTSSSSDGTMIGAPYGTSSFGGTMTAEPYSGTMIGGGAGISSSFDGTSTHSGTAIVGPYETGTSFSSGGTATVSG
jgi:hypothetical protein